MTVLNRFYVSGGADIELLTLQIDVDGSTVLGVDPQRHFFVQGFEDISAALETGEVVKFSEFAMKIAIPARNADGSQDLKFALCNVDGEVSGALRVALEGRLKMHATLRTYLYSDLSSPSQRPFRFEVKSGQWSAMQVDVTAGYRNIMDTGWPRLLYTLDKYPGLRYF